ncbi:MAG: hypothetical protein IJG84_19430 [Kiritimatiellae bacterium]|nr:hypothetical protein [Kiritimatiellia bacterium]
MAWNRNNSRSQRGAAAARKPRVLLVALVLLVLGAGVWWAVRGGGGTASATDVRKAGRIAERKPDLPKARVEEAPRGEVAERRSNVPPEQRVMHTNVYGYVINRPHTAVVITNKLDDAEKPVEERIFSNSADQKIAGLLLLEPGEMLVGDATSLFGRGFTRAFLKSIETPIVVEEGDDQFTAELKRAVREAKKELKAKYDAGEDIGKLMLEEVRELQEIGLYREELKDQVAKFSRDKSQSEEDLGDFVKAANMLLESRGGKPLKMPRFAARRFALDRARRGEEPGGEQEKGDVE